MGMRERRLKDSDSNRELKSKFNKKDFYMKKFKVFLAVIIATAFISSAITLTISASGPTGFGTVIEPGSMVEDANYIVFEDSGAYYAKNGNTGEIDHYGTNAKVVIQEAINATSSVGGTVLLREGVYTLTQTLEMKSWVNLKGTHQNLVVLKAGAAVDLLNTSASATTYGFSITGMTLSGDGRAYSSAGLKLGQFNDVYLSDLSIRDFGGCGVNLTKGTTFTFEEGIIWNCGNDTGTIPAMHLYNSVVGDLTYLKLSKINFAENHYADILVKAYVEGLDIDYCWFEGAGTPVDPSTYKFAVTGPSNALKSCHIQKCRFYDPTGSTSRFIHVSSALAFDITECYFTSGTSTSTEPISLTSVTRGFISHNTFGIANTAIVGSQIALTTCSELTIQSNSISGTASASLKVVNSAKVRLEYNTITASTLYTILFTSLNYNITAIGNTLGKSNTDVYATNDVTGYFAGNYFTSVTFAAARPTLEGNIGYVTENKGTATITTSTSVAFNHGLATTPTLVLASFNLASYGNYTWTATTTQITITVSTSGTYTVYWYAEV